ncbi:hypothetical protein [Microcystis phage Mae-Yong924-2]|nr:hypothetical protein [Microcystis phage Mae-Yong924-2]
MNLGKKGAYLNTGIPGTGLYDRHRLDKPERNVGNNRNHENLGAPQSSERDLSEYFFMGDKKEIESGPVSGLTSPGLEKLKEELIACHEQFHELESKLSTQKAVYRFCYLIEILSYIMVFGFFWKKAKEIRIEQQSKMDDLSALLGLTKIKVDLNADEKVIDAYLKLRDKYELLAQSHEIWDVTSTAKIDRAKTRSAAGTAITPKPVRFTFKSIDYLDMDCKPIHLQNANGGDLYLYPGFLVVYISKTNFALIELHDLELDFSSTLFIEESTVPKDAIIHSHTWTKVNKDGSRDKRFKDNRQIPVCKYGKLTLFSKKGLNEEYMISSFEKTQMFYESFLAFRKTYTL